MVLSARSVGLFNTSTHVQHLLPPRDVPVVGHWPVRNDEIHCLLVKYFTGCLSDVAPAAVDGQVLEERMGEDGSTRRQVRLTLKNIDT
jgi:hypothetical protein